MKGMKKMKKTFVVLAALAVCAALFAVYFMKNMKNMENVENMESTETNGVAAAAGAAAITAGVKTFPKFSTKNFSGAAVGETIFAGKKITMVNFWATWCPPCVAEMPDLGDLSRGLPEEAGLIGILTDAEQSGAAMKAAQILREAGADFPQLYPSAEMAGLLNEIEAIPTSILVDSEGVIVGEPIVGAFPKEFYEEAILKALAGR